MRNFQDTFETRKRSFIGAFPVCMTVPLMQLIDQISFNINTRNKLFLKRILKCERAKILLIANRNNVSYYTIYICWVVESFNM